MKGFWTKRVPALERMVLVESGDRDICDKLLPVFYGQCSHIDLVTCYAGEPNSFRAEGGQVYHVHNYSGAEGRGRLYAELRTRRYSAIGIVCAEQPIMTKWKWMLAAKVPAKLLVINENRDFFWVDRGNWRTILHFMLFRAGLSGAEAVQTIGRLLMFPFAVLFLVVYALYAHSKRIINARNTGFRERRS